MMDEREIKERLEAAANTLFADQPDVFDFTSETNQTEWNLAHHLANEIHKYFADFHCDLDITKRSLANRRPDIIIHKRGLHDFNLLVIEVKLNGTPSGINKDNKKIERDWFSNPLNYKFGATVNIKRNKILQILVVTNDKMARKKDPT